MNKRQKSFTVIVAVSLVIVIAISLMFIQKDVRFSNASSRVTTSQYFDIESTLTPDNSEPDTSILEIAFTYKDKNNWMVDRASMKVYPTIGTQHLSQPAMIIASHFFFKVPSREEHPSSMDLSLKFKLDSANTVIEKTAKFQGLKENTIYRFKPGLH